MDYCSSCRRHLNGAPVCPGCGACSPDIAPSLAGDRIRRARSAVATPMSDAPGAMVTTGDSTAPRAWHDDAVTGEEAFGAVPGEEPLVGPSDELDGVPLSRDGRAARRRQRARWKKTQRRAVVATAVAFVGGGLTIATMDRHSTDRTRAQPRLRTTGPWALSRIHRQSPPTRRRDRATLTGRCAPPLARRSRRRPTPHASSPSRPYPRRRRRSPDRKPLPLPHRLRRRPRSHRPLPLTPAMSYPRPPHPPQSSRPLPQPLTARTRTRPRPAPLPLRRRRRRSACSWCASADRHSVPVREFEHGTSLYLERGACERCFVGHVEWPPHT